jgi:LmbE family N-acetylglucosaminyl deacetylase
MCVIAHPDDECVAFGGALALAAEQGAETYVVCLTDGQAGSYRGNAQTGEELGRMRREEFLRSCAMLGVGRQELLDYQDAKLEFADFSRAAGRLVRRMREFRPDVVLTFGADGGLNTHPDHTMVSSLATAAFHWAGLERRYPELGPVHRAGRLFHLSTDVFLEGRPEPMPSPWSLVLDVRTVKEIKQEAFRQHVSQAPLMEKTQSFFEKHGGNEVYALMARRGAGAATALAGMFEGLEA